MACENYIRDLAAYLSAGNLADLTLIFDTESRHIHKVIACTHSKWFQNAITSGFKESTSDTITLHDGPAFTNAINCMITYFNTATYSPADYDTPAPLLHAQVAAIADKYDCKSLFTLARNSFASTVSHADATEWQAIAAFVYEHTTSTMAAHVDLRNLVVAAVAERPAVLKAVLKAESGVELLKSDAELVTDVLFIVGMRSRKASGNEHYIFRCDNCQYMHAGSRDCKNVIPKYPGVIGRCPQCRKSAEARIERYERGAKMVDGFQCPLCDGSHTIDPNFPAEIKSDDRDFYM